MEKDKVQLRNHPRRSYGSVFKAHFKETGEIVAIKQVPVESDLQEIIKEISIMQQCCKSPHVVRYYGSYFKNTDLWIVMEYCAAGSVIDIIRLRGKTMSEEEVSTILQSTLKGLEYLHFMRKIHRDIKAGNILLTGEGQAKLADFGVAGQLTDTMAKRNTVIGTPFWMAPEVIQEIGYNCVADAIFMIPTNPAPTLRDPSLWSLLFIDFIAQCLVKNAENRATATQLLQDEDEVDQGTMVLAGSAGSDTVRLGGTGPYPGTRGELDTGTMVSQLGTMMRSWTVDELRARLASLDPQMEQEVEEIHQRYQAKRQPILDAIQAKKRHQHNF
ncbi:hypothetical protein NHX12_030540 [Muraenolepis orangiensis]|uniref:Non-specific serine/threonine protein kinase n=1 Tax=Muraenolepis orangiensis TaxID=630683 RepID=A0A9Q0EE58_9TELE|nr:hypothetical protein NHX12_030540 [Muraenolepis orangiensis]